MEDIGYILSEAFRVQEIVGNKINEGGKKHASSNRATA